jgi:hypothetical protein
MPRFLIRAASVLTMVFPVLAVRTVSAESSEAVNPPAFSVNQPWIEYEREERHDISGDDALHAEFLGADAPMYQSTINPTLIWNTFLGEDGYESGFAVTVDGSGNVYVAGDGNSTWGDPVRAFSGIKDAFAAKLDYEGNLVWHTFLGGSGHDYGYGIAVDEAGNAYVIGNSNSSWGDPVQVYSGEMDAFLAVLDSSGNLVWNTFLGGSRRDYGSDVAVDGDGYAYVAGTSCGTWGDPVRGYTPNDDPIRQTHDVFVAKVDSTGHRLWNTFLGSGDTDDGRGIAVNGLGAVFVTGDSYVTWGNPVSPKPKGRDAFAAKLNSDGALVWNNFLVNNGSDLGMAVAADSLGGVYATGIIEYSMDNGPPFIVHYDTSGNLVMKIVMEMIYVGMGNGLAVDGMGNVFLVGTTFEGKNDAFVALIGSTITPWHTVLGGIESDYGRGIAADDSGNVFVVGTSSASWGYPVEEWSGDRDVFLARFAVPVSIRAFAKNNPADETYMTTSPILSWGESGDAEGFEYCIDITDNDSCDGSWISTGNSRSVSLSGLTANTTYYWQVRAVNDVGSLYADGGLWWSIIALPVSFADVPSSHWAWSWVERLFAAGITSGCGGGNYCPNDPVTRAEMAIFLERGIHGSSYTPPAANGTVFGDVPISHWAAAWIEQLAADGITSGCGGGNYCPNDPVTRAEVAIFLLRSKHGSSYTPPAATGTVFGDVPISHWAAAWIEQLAAEGITSGCGGGNYCPNNPVTRAEMAIFLVRTFDLP